MLSLLIAQENHFSQFFNCPQLLNPAFSGDASYVRAGLNSRNIQTKIDTYVPNSLLHLDLKLTNHNDGIGLVIYNHLEEIGHTKFQFNYAHTVKLDKLWWLKSGIGLSVNQRKLAGKDLKFPDQYNNSGYTGQQTQEPSLKESTYFPGVAAGAILYNKNFWLSISGDYLNKPTENFAGTKTNYPIKFSAMSGFLIPLSKNKSSKRRFSNFGGLKPTSSLGPVFCYQQHGQQIEFSSGINFLLQPFFGGVLYRFQHYHEIDRKAYAYKAVSLIAGFRREEFSVSYSFDYTIGKELSKQVTAHEFSLILYFFSPKHDYKRVLLVPLPNQLIY